MALNYVYKIGCYEEAGDSFSTKMRKLARLKNF